MIEDWDDAYANGAHIQGADAYPDRWAAAAQAFRQTLAAQDRAQLELAYGPGDRHRFDLFHPQSEASGLLVFVHGGYWRAFDKSWWSHLAAGALHQGWSVALPSYDLVPTVRIGEITSQVASAIAAAASKVPGPLRLCGHSAGGHLVTRMICRDSPLDARVRGGITRVVSISGLHDMRPLLNTDMNRDFRMDETEARAESVALNTPVDGVELVCWVGADERPEFIRQADLLANIWTGFGLRTSVVHAPGRHHFDVIDDLADPDSALLHALIDSSE